MPRVAYRFTPVALALLALLATLAVTACEEDPGDTCPAVTVKFPDGKALGFECTKDEECKYGMCYKGSPTNFATDFGICTKNCSCGEGSDCADEGYYPGSSEALFQCVRPSISTQPDGKKDTAAAFCVAQCLNGISDCDAYGDFYTDCAVPETGSLDRLCLVK